MIATENPSTSLDVIVFLEGANSDDYSKLGMQSKGRREEGLLGGLGSFMGNLFRSKKEESLKPFEGMSPEAQQEIATLMGWIYGMSQRVTMQDTPSTVRKKVEYITKRLDAMESQYEVSAILLENKPGMLCLTCHD